MVKSIAERISLETLADRDRRDILYLKTPFQQRASLPYTCTGEARQVWSTLKVAERKMLYVALAIVILLCLIEHQPTPVVIPTHARF